MYVNILLSTYNGEQFLGQQLESLFRQSFSNFTILVRDDGSADQTVQLIRDCRDQRLVLIEEGPHLGVVGSFLRLLTLADPGADYYAFCDQDDIWMPHKMERALNRLGLLKDHPVVLYCSRQILVDEALNILGQSPKYPRGPNFRNALVQNIATGCTVVISRGARELLLRPSPPDIVMHDWWMYLVVSAFGKVIFDAEPTVYYRQHRENVVGSRVRWMKKWQRRCYLFFSESYFDRIIRQVHSFVHLYGDDLSDEQRRLIDRFLNFRANLQSRIGYFLKPDVFLQNRLDQALFRLAFLIV